MHTREKITSLISKFKLSYQNLKVANNVYLGSLWNIRRFKEGRFLLSSSDLNFKEIGVYWRSHRTIWYCFSHSPKGHACCSTVAVAKHQRPETVSRRLDFRHWIYPLSVRFLSSGKIPIFVSIVSSGEKAFKKRSFKHKDAKPKQATITSRQSEYFRNNE